MHWIYKIRFDLKNFKWSRQTSSEIKRGSFQTNLKRAFDLLDPHRIWHRVNEIQFDWISFCGFCGCIKNKSTSIHYSGAQFTAQIDAYMNKWTFYIHILSECACGHLKWSKHLCITFTSTLNSWHIHSNIQLMQLLTLKLYCIHRATIWIIRYALIS